eukprot:518556_1
MLPSTRTTTYLWVFSNWKTICQISCCIQLFIITTYILIFSSPCDDAQLAMSVFTSSDEINGDDLSLYPIPVHSKDFKYNNIDTDNKLPITSLNKMIEFSSKMSSIYRDYGIDETIFVALASYRDNECVNTIINAFETAMYPDRIRFGIFQQHNITDGDCTDYDKLINCDHRYGIIHPLCGRFWQIQIDRIDFKDAKGPMYGRYRAELFYSNEDYAMQIDAHTRFVPLWDNILIDMFKRVNNDHAVFTTYPKATDEKSQNWLPPISKPITPVVAICKTKLLDRSYMFKHERGHFVHNPSRPVYTIFFAAGFSFAKGHKLKNVPSDPYLPYLFDGEEILMTIRLFTNGYDLYMPDRDIIFHIYEEHRKRPLFWHDNWNRDKQKFEKKAQNRLLYILKLLKKYKPAIMDNTIVFNMSVDIRDIEKYNLGNKRDINDYWKWIDMDFDKKESGDFCTEIQKGKIKRLPIKQDKT